VSVARNDGYAPRVWCGRQKRQDSSAVISTISVAMNVCVPQSSASRDGAEGGGGYILPVCLTLPALKRLLGAVTATIRQHVLLEVGLQNVVHARRGLHAFSVRTYENGGKPVSFALDWAW